MIHIYIGEGKGKTTCAYGLCLRARGWNKKVCIIQFLKSRDFVCGEVIAARRLGISIVCFNQKHPLFCSGIKDLKLKERILKGLKKVQGILKSKKYDVVVLDEIINALDQGYIKEAEIISLIKQTPLKTELILTGRGKLSKELISCADYITEMRLIKHPFRNKILARKGIEF